MSKWGWRQGKFGFRKRKDATWELKGKIWQPVLMEEHVIREITERLWYAGIKVWRVRERIPGYGKPSTPGIPDLIGIVPGGRALFLEVKKPGGKHRPAQEAFILEAKNAGAVAFFATSYAAVRSEFRAIGVELPK